ncbi:MAG: DUF4230 domain-containing protein [Eubacterium sp.]|nr:DUF4230 domain-containing protein [Eubacterium sp.]
MQQENHTEEPGTNKSFHLRDLPALIKSIFLIVILLLLIWMLWRHFENGSHKNQELTLTETSSKLEKVLKISELSTYQVTFNGVANVTDADEQLLYHVAYKAKVRIGIDMEDITVSAEDIKNPDSPAEGKKKIIVALPPVEIADVDVDPGSLDYIFIDSSADTPDVSITALPACKKDAEADCQSNALLFELARDNAVNTVEALMRPFLVQNKDYELEISL